MDVILILGARRWAPHLKSLRKKKRMKLLSQRPHTGRKLKVSLAKTFPQIRQDYSTSVNLYSIGATFWVCILR